MRAIAQTETTAPNKTEQKVFNVFIVKYMLSQKGLVVKLEKGIKVPPKACVIHFVGMRVKKVEISAKIKRGCFQHQKRLF
jgi:hypothetical protein